MKKIPLTRGEVALVDDEDFALVNRHKWHVITGQHCMYAATNIPQGDGTFRYILLHRFVAGVIDEPKSIIDHVDFNGLNNTRKNLRVCMKWQNNAHRRSRIGSSRYKGVHWCRTWKKWVAQISFKGKKVKIGSFADEKTAAIAYNAVAQMLHGDFAHLNDV